MKIAPVLLPLFIASQMGASAVTVALNSSAETTLNETTVNNNMGGHATFHAGTTNGSQDRRGLVAFDVSTIPAGAIVTAATLSLRVPSGSTAVSSNFGLHRMLTPWGEGNKAGNNGAAAAAGEATWNDTGTGAWGAPGGAAGADYLGASSASTSVAGLGGYTWTSVGLVADVQGWVDGSADNNGWILISESEGTGGTARRFGANGLPELTVDYVIPEPGTVLLTGIGVFAGILRRRR